MTASTIVIVQQKLPENIRIVTSQDVHGINENQTFFLQQEGVLKKFPWISYIFAGTFFSMSCTFCIYVKFYSVLDSPDVIFTQRDVIFEWYIDDVIVFRSSAAILNHVFEEASELLLMRVVMKNQGLIVLHFFIF